MTATCPFDSLAETDTDRSAPSLALAPSGSLRSLQHGRQMQPLPMIVLAEDDLALRALLATALERVGYRVIQVGTGDELVGAVRRLREEGDPLGLVVTDVRMPTLGGVEAARQLRAEGLAIPLIFMTAFGDTWTRSQAADLGALLLDKPLSLTVLRQAVRRAIGA